MSFGIVWMDLKTACWKQYVSASVVTIMPQVEIKLASTLNEMPHLKQSLLEMASEGQATSPESFDTYYDTADDALRRKLQGFSTRAMNGSRLHRPF